MVVVTMGLTVILWIFGDKIGVSSVTAAMLGISLQLMSGVLSWQDCLNEVGLYTLLMRLTHGLQMSGFSPCTY
jgi:DASS family divalent anion:Na+ symporter